MRRWLTGAATLVAALAGVTGRAQPPGPYIFVPAAATVNFDNGPGSFILEVPEIDGYQLTAWSIMWGFDATAVGTWQIINPLFGDIGVAMTAGASINISTDGFSRTFARTVNDSNSWCCHNGAVGVQSMYNHIASENYEFLTTGIRSLTSGTHAVSVTGVGDPGSFTDYATSHEGYISYSNFKITSFFLEYEPVPEPTSWLMMVGGFGAIGATVRLRRAGLSMT